MNIFKKAYCRIYQGVFRLMLPLLPYREPKILKTNEEVASLLKAKGKQSVLLVTDKGIRRLGLTKNWKKSLPQRAWGFQFLMMLSQTLQRKMFQTV